MRAELVTLRKLYRRWREKGGRGPAAALEARRRRFYDELWRTAAVALGADVTDLGGERLLLERGTAWTVVRRFEVALDSRLVLQLAGDKPFVLTRLAAAGVPVPAHATFPSGDVEAAWTWARAQPGAVVVKPARDGSAGKGVTTNVHDRAQLARALRRAGAYASTALLEQHVPGASYRLLYLRGRLLDVIRRDSPAVVGDGRRSIAALVAAANAARLAGDVPAFHLLVDDLELRATLRAQGLTRASVPAAGARVVVKRAVNQGSAEDARSARSEAHPEWVALGALAARTLRVEWAGVDVLAEDLAAPPRAGGVVGEVNTTPALHHHVLLREPAEAAPVTRTLLAELLRTPAWVAADAEERGA